MAQGRGEPAARPGAVVVPSSPMPQVRRPPSATVARAPHHAVTDLWPPMPQLNADQPSACEGPLALRVRVRAFIGHGDSRRLGSRIEAQLYARDVGTRPGSVSEPDGERSLVCHDGTTPVEQLACPGRVAGHQRFAPLRQYEHPVRCRAGSVTAPGLCHGRCRSSGSGVPPTGPGAVPAGLPSPMFPAGTRPCGRESVSRFVPTPGGVCARGFQGRLLRKHSLVGPRGGQARTDFPELGVGCVTFQFNDLTCRTREHLQGVPGECLRT